MSKTKSGKCETCEKRTTCYRWCQACQAVRRLAEKRIVAEGMQVGEAGGLWWIWDARGEIVVMGKHSRVAVVHALATGDEAEAA